VIEGHRVILRETVQSHSSKEGTHAMTAAHNIDLPAVLAERLTTAHPDVLRELLATFIHTLMGAEADALCGAGYGERSTERTNSRNGYRHRQFDTRAGSLDLAIPKLRQGSYFPDWLLERRKRAEGSAPSLVDSLMCPGLGGVAILGFKPRVGRIGVAIRTLSECACREQNGGVGGCGRSPSSRRSR
jgi:Transposase, Mutator family